MKRVGLFLLLVVASCTRHVKSEGTVYSKYHYPMRHVTVFIPRFTSGSDEPFTEEKATTDDAGHFTFNFWAGKGLYFGVSVDFDSGYYYKKFLSASDLKHYDVTLWEK